MATTPRMSGIQFLQWRCKLWKTSAYFLRQRVSWSIQSHLVRRLKCRCNGERPTIFQWNTYHPGCQYLGFSILQRSGRRFSLTLPGTRTYGQRIISWVNNTNVISHELRITLTGNWWNAHAEPVWNNCARSWRRTVLRSRTWFGMGCCFCTGRGGRYSTCSNHCGLIYPNKLTLEHIGCLEFLSGHDTYPEIQRKAQAEIDAVVGRERLPTISNSASLPYVRNLLAEAFRWNPAIPLSQNLSR